MSQIQTGPFVPSFGALPTGKRSAKAVALAIFVNAAILALAIFLSFTAKHAVVLHRYRVTALTAPTTPLPPKIHLPSPPEVQPLKLEKTEIEPPKITPPTPAPSIKPIEIKAPKPSFVAVMKRVVLAPQVKQVFALAKAQVTHSERRTVTSVNFGGASARKSTTREVIRSAAFGDEMVGNDPHRMGRVSSAGFGGSSGDAKGPARGHVASANFGGASGTNQERAGGRVASTGFGAMQKAAAAERTQAPSDATSLIILSKPHVAYTAAARAKHIQGSVILSVTFTASGQVIVHSVVHGLGYGLDEEARRVARGIRFRPAKRGGQPVDVTTEITITFQLA